MPPPRDFEHVESNLRTSLEFFARSHPYGAVVKESGITMVYCGRDYPLFNTALLHERVHNDLPDRIRTAANYFGRLGVGWSSWICEDLLDEITRRSLRNTMNNLRMQMVVDPPGMIARQLAPQQRPLPVLEVKRAADQSTLLEFSHITAVVFDIPFPVSCDLYGKPEAWQSKYTGYVGYYRGNAVCTAMLVVDNGVAGVYSVATLNAYRRKGFAEAIVRYVFEQAQMVHGAQACILQSSRSGFNVYQRMGFRTVTHFSVYRYMT